jgi:Fe-S-cluster-containing hydrogenase component 2
METPQHKKLFVNQKLCTGCRACELVCVAFHDRRFGLENSRIRITKIEPLGIDSPNICRQCHNAPCMDACPVDALLKDPMTGAVQLVEENCIGCGECVEVCPFGAAAMHTVTGKVLICDLCGGDPMCVKRCPTRAITYEDPGTRLDKRRMELAVQSGKSKRRKP